jgi:hypothetical protein
MESKRTKPYKLSAADQVQAEQMVWFTTQFLRYLMDKYPNVLIAGDISTTNEVFTRTTKYMNVQYFLTVGGVTCQLYTIQSAKQIMQEDWPFTRLLQFVEHPDRCLQTVVQTYGEVLRSASSGGKEKEA